MTAYQPRIRLERLFGYMYDHLNRAYILNQGGLKPGASALSDHGGPGKVAEYFRTPFIVAGVVLIHRDGLAEAEMSQPYRKIVLLLQVTHAFRALKPIRDLEHEDSIT
jgi:hypothetical protein